MAAEPMQPEAPRLPPNEDAIVFEDISDDEFERSRVEGQVYSSDEEPE